MIVGLATISGVISFQRELGMLLYFLALPLSPLPLTGLPIDIACRNTDRKPPPVLFGP